MFVTKGPRLRHQYTSEIVLTALAKKGSGFWGVLEWHAVPKARTDTWHICPQLTCQNSSYYPVLEGRQRCLSCRRPSGHTDQQHRRLSLRMTRAVSSSVIQKHPSEDLHHWNSLLLLAQHRGPVWRRGESHVLFCLEFVSWPFVPDSLHTSFWGERNKETGLGSNLKQEGFVEKLRCQSNTLDLFSFSLCIRKMGTVRYRL